MGRPPIGKVAMTGAERTRLYRLKRAEEMPTQEEADESFQNTLYNHARLIVDNEMSGETRQRFFAHLKKKYHVGFSQSDSQRSDKGLPA